MVSSRLPYEELDLEEVNGSGQLSWDYNSLPNYEGSV